MMNVEYLDDFLAELDDFTATEKTTNKKRKGNSLHCICATN